MTQPDVSFILPTFNVESYLSDCLESILAQQCSKEILIINDGSTDGSLNIAKQYQQKYPFITIVDQSNKGVSSARNVGLRLAQGRYTAFVDPDDELETQHLADLIHQADQEKVDILRGQVLLFNQDLEIDNLVPTRLENIDPHRGKLVSGIQYFFALSSHFWFPTIWNGFYRTEFLHRYNLSFRDGFRCGEDNLFVLETLLAPAHVRVLEVNDIFYRYKLREGSLCTTQANLIYIIDVFKIAKIMLDKAFELRHVNIHSRERLFNAIYDLCYETYDTKYQYLPLSDQITVCQHLSPALIRALEIDGRMKFYRV